ncbi:MAG TPA: MbcA/ParS/Xre antitoxin family protein [Gammaproteobacteria bacterium]|nr:MbcA/ParS/Xre antitoxin family protein [Gammaproteobacteria bacterium]
MAEPLPLTPARADPEALGAAALQAFFSITARWALGAEDERILLGNPPRSTFFKWKKERAARLGNDVLERISYVMGIYKALHILLPDARAADSWPTRPNAAPLFGGRSAIEKMRGGRVVDLADVRRYLDAERG